MHQRRRSPGSINHAPRPAVDGVGKQPRFAAGSQLRGDRTLSACQRALPAARPPHPCLGSRQTISLLIRLRPCPSGRQFNREEVAGISQRVQALALGFQLNEPALFQLPRHACTLLPLACHPQCRQQEGCPLATASLCPFSSLRGRCSGDGRISPSFLSTGIGRAGRRVSQRCCTRHSGQATPSLLST